MIKTHQPISNDENKILHDISHFWNKVSFCWNRVWGPHIHHGYYEEQGDRISHLEAQEKLLDKISDLLNISENSYILDVGCGLGGTTRFLAQHFNAKVTGITLSQEQKTIAESETPEFLSRNVSYFLEDAHHLHSFNDHTFDIVWSLESAEQFYNKTQFIQEAFRVLKPGGQLMITTWCASKETFEGKEADLYRRICRDFQCPYMPTIDYYSDILNEQGNVYYVDDWSQYVKKSWTFGIHHLNTISWFTLLKLGGLTGFRFVRQLHYMREAFESGLLRYGVFIAGKQTFE